MKSIKKSAKFMYMEEEYQFGVTIEWNYTTVL